MNHAATIAIQTIVGPRPAAGEIRLIIFRVFALFVFSIPFEAVFAQEQSVFSLSKMTGLLLFLVCLSQPRECFRRVPGALWFFAVYVWIYVFLGFFQEARYQEEMFGRLFSLVQMIMLFWIAYNILSEDKTAEYFLIPYAFACALISILQLTNVTSTPVANEQPMRISFFGEDPNGAASVLALGILAFIGRFYLPLRVRRLTAILLLLPLGIVLLSIASTASRGGMLALVTGLLILGLGQGSRQARIRNAAGLLFFLVIVAGIIIQNDVAVERWESTVQEGSTAGRTDIFRETLRMFKERPVFGWGPVHYSYELGNRMHYWPLRDTHNQLLALLAEVGIVGTLPYLAAVALCTISAWRARRSSPGILPFAMLMTLFVINASLSWQNRKPHWIILAYALASGVSAARDSGRRWLSRAPWPVRSRTTPNEAGQPGHLIAELSQGAK